MSRAEGPMFRLTLRCLARHGAEPEPPHIRLRRLLKSILRSHGFRAEVVEELDKAPDVQSRLAKLVAAWGFLADEMRPGSRSLLIESSTLAYARCQGNRMEGTSMNDHDVELVLIGQLENLLAFLKSPRTDTHEPI